ncbi:hypothetical protein A3C59_00170 [Candidatus Daviesbacteria bacterium RIFCSPHIGHO2_02_FULL_36_13]|uniref:Response regulatory domain-containing protein n=1 Tax=Candidatus Daviesbacteria bacterium RIFCSPHIGHO2_02_FULL_36_13 TaxID=1797768 RepID=A0A1F5JYC7_9BACT|nr:MAG: hypothetical protein A3C59_00170 [Candidatus Daviesbacteria bacterium RIFCSPHIGHO2_02_FULL_36_13]
MSQETQPHILVVENQASLSRFMVSLLNSNGFRTTLSPEGSHAMKVLERESVDVITIEPIAGITQDGAEMSGFDLLKLLKKHERFSQIPRILVSRMPLYHPIHKEDIEGEHVLLQPIDPEEFIQKIREVRRFSSFDPVA